MPRKQVLGRGLDVLIPGVDSSQFGPSDFFYCDIDTIRANPYQPRRTFTKQELKALSDSIKANGVIQPLVVRSVSGGYELIVGERRWRSCRMAGLKRVPVVVRDVSGSEMLEMALIENIHREDLNPLEKAEAYYRLMDEFGLTQEKVAKRVGQNRSTVANFLRLRSLPGEIRDDIVNNTLSMGHARALLGAETPTQQKAAWRRIVSKNLSVRAAETFIKKLKTGESGKHRSRAPSSEDVYLQSVADDLTQLFATKVRIVRRGKKGRLEIEFYGNEDLDRLVSRLKAS
ncbi:MAG: ParB/RepB/Spo0J family partition protein [Deltaproteobacteria bacterium]|nr:ParB/RepB/Spo0J family partition protein [Deltaproteobacteria bacterium]MBW2266672.1 ParB/RepB/Spo0J family partition protein [Deltaproteobacteria bacterium]MBW2318604.1 ParB/RepB/Spo0J family partition protein [Deltaproteobacteria bacterium]MBW2602551.1 ParB/RepB/Spo0J family partition protein [Deltaproteobacteria bacterium]OEU46642.1 MAG: chromosome partitioning protein ParB [Desulfobacterales bacterium S7086C20]